MRRTRLSVIVSVLALLVLMPLLAQRGRGPQGSGRQMGSVDDELTYWKTELDLSDEQTEQIKPLLQKSRKQMTELRRSSGGPSPEMFEGMRKIQTELTDGLKPILSEDQMKRYQKMMEERMQRRRGRGRGRQQ